MATKEAKENEKACNCNEKCECGCKCGCCCGCKGKFLKLIALIIVFLAGIGCGCLLCCCNGCKNHRRMPPAPMDMVKHGMHGPKNNVIVIRTDGDEVVPEVAKMDENFRNLHRHHPNRHAPVPAPANAPASVETPAPAEVPAEAPAKPEVPSEPETK